MKYSDWNWSAYNCIKIIENTVVLFNKVSNSIITVEKEIYEGGRETGN